MTRVIDNEKLIARNTQIGRYASGAGLVVLLGGLVFSFLQRENDALYWVPLVTLLIGFLLSNVGIYYANRFVRSPRAHESIANALKGLSNDEYDLYNYYFPAPHVLLAPSGIYTFVTRFQSGEVVWNSRRKRIDHKGASLFRSIFGQEGMGDPFREALADKEGMENYLRQRLNTDEIPPVHPVVLFIDPKADVEEMPEAPVPVLTVKNLKQTLRNASRAERVLDIDEIDALEEAIGLE